MPVAESTVEEALLYWLRGDLGWDSVAGPEIAPDGSTPERQSWNSVILEDRLHRALGNINPHLPPQAIDDALRRVSVPSGATLLANNQAFHRMLMDGVPVEFPGQDGRIVGDRARLLDLENLDRNDWLAVNQFSVVEGQYTRRPDVVLFINGIPLVVIELKNVADPSATQLDAYNQLQTYKAQIPSLFTCNELLVISDGSEAGLGTLTSGFRRFMPWKTIDGEVEVSGYNQLEVLARGVFDRRRLLDLLTSFIVFENDGAVVSKKVAAYHQYWAVNKAIDCTLLAASPDGDRRVGVVWHTQGSGKSLSMVFYAGKVIRHPAMQNPTLIVLTDRNDLDDQLYNAFTLAIDLLPEAPQQARNRQDLKRLIQVASGGIVFTTVQKFAVNGDGSYPLLSDRHNIVVITDEAHRSQYDFVDGFAHNIRQGLPNASFIGFTGTPIEVGDRVTRNVFGDYIDIYDVAQAVEDGATVPIYYEGRLAEIDLDPSLQPQIDPDFEEITETEEEATKRRLQTKWARIEAVVGTERRLEAIAADIVSHFEARSSSMDGKGMIVCMSRRICADLYNTIVGLRPDWHADSDMEGRIKVVITGSASDPSELRTHIRNKVRNEAIKQRLKDPTDPLFLVIVRDMWLTGFDAPCLHTMYVDKPMKGHTLMQAIARVNRVFKDKPGGLVVDYIGLGEALKRAFRDYTDSKGRGEVAIDVGAAVATLQEKLEVCRSLLYGFDYEGYRSDDPARRLGAITGALDYLEGKENGRERFVVASGALLKAFRLAGATPDALRARDEVAFLLAVRGRFQKLTASQQTTGDELDFAIGQLVSKAVISGGVKDLFAEAGIDRPDISLFDDEFLSEVRDLPYRNLAVAALERLLREEIKIRSHRNVVEARRFSEMLDASMRKYHNRSIEAAQVVLELVEMAKEFRVLAERGAKLNLTDDELAFYDALATNDSAVELMSDETLRAMARELASTLQNSVTVDWAVRESARAALRLQVKRLLRKYRYPPDQQDAATHLVLEQAEVLCEHWTASSSDSFRHRFP